MLCWKERNEQMVHTFAYNIENNKYDTVVSHAELSVWNLDTFTNETLCRYALVSPSARSKTTDSLGI